MRERLRVANRSMGKRKEENRNKKKKKQEERRSQNRITSGERGGGCKVLNFLLTIHRIKKRKEKKKERGKRPIRKQQLGVVYGEMKKKKKSAARFSIFV